MSNVSFSNCGCCNGVNFTVNSGGPPGLTAFEEWKKKKNLPGATWEEFIAANVFHFDDLSDEQKAQLSFTYDKFTAEQLEALRGPRGFRGYGIVSWQYVSTAMDGVSKTYRISFENGEEYPYIVKDGYTPYIRDNYWWINGVNTGLVAKALTPEFRIVGNNLVYNYQGFSTQYPLFSLIEIGSGKVTYAERVALSPQEGLKVFQTDGAKGEYQYVNGAWYFIGNKFSKQITGGSYTLQESDIGYIIEFTQDMAGVDVELHVPIDVFKDGHIIDIVQMGASKVKIIPANLMDHHIDDVYINMRTFGRVAEAKIRFKGARECVIMGGLE